MKTIMSVIIVLIFLTGIKADFPYAQEAPGKAIVFIDPTDKQNISGYVHIALAWGDRLTPPRHLLRGFINLKEAMLRYTNVETKIDSHVYLSSAEILKMPFVYVTTDKAFDISEVEKRNLKQFFDNGGFMFLETAQPGVESSQSEAALKQMLRDTLGAHARFAPIPENHRLYHSFFDFDDGPPQGAEITESNIESISAYVPRQIYYLEGIWYKNRLVAVYSSKGYIVKWQDMANNEPQLKMGVNLIVFSLIQEGSIAEQEVAD